MEFTEPATKRKAARKAARKSKLYRKDGIKLLLMALPFVILAFAFSYVPLFGWIYAFFDYRPGIPLSNTEFIGLENFRTMFSDPRMGPVLINTLALSLLSIATAPIPMLFAIMVSEVKSEWFKRLVQTTSTLPHYISWIIVFSLAFSMFSTEGAVNSILFKLGLSDTPVNVLGNYDRVWTVQTLLLLWKSVGWSAIIYLAAIVSIDSEQYDAARVDGAGRLRTIWHITVPSIMPTFIVLLLLSVSNLLSAGFEQYLVFSNVMIADRIEVLDLYVYRLGLVTGDYSYSTAVGIFKSVISIILLFTVNFLSKKFRGQGIV
ncbi:ABC-type polysaccharide transport system permease subunit [Paenibacillus phyllosphaerae]|uniref:ABC-type polysaccharide transport system permease subunit n=1 Tax=Paenibacillus phyllosphaerae TaxID=274593 RepID=A0A7W5AZS7_9BACL|nr:ABC transporter permease subunit [Paenibacillus phyllosphaerae]MBB3111051.1 ABC-type polysaccharide transport system permease subunit [Paenibacillus phyllosphaerae]